MYVGDVPNQLPLHTSVCKTNLTVVVDTNCMYKYVSYTNLLVPMSMCCVHVCCVHALVSVLCEGKNYCGCSSTLKYGNHRLLGVFGGMLPGKFELQR